MESYRKTNYSHEGLAYPSSTFSEIQSFKSQSAMSTRANRLINENNTTGCLRKIWAVTFVSYPEALLEEKKGEIDIFMA